jgi:serine/threonine protein phosphatase PrpC
MRKVSPHTPALFVSVGAQCDVGRQRTENQDRISRASTPFGDLFMVADGVGGYEGGAEAAQLTIEGFTTYLNSHGALPLQQALQEAAQLVGDEVVRRGSADPSHHHMASTVVLCVVQGTHVTCAHAGDSRAYLVRHGRMRQLTRDHSVIERLVSQGVLDPVSAREHPDASVLTRVLGKPGATLDITELEVEAGDGLLLCSDGLWAYAEETEIEAVVASKSLSAPGVADALLSLALEGGGGDNISIQYLRFEGTAPRGRAGQPLSRKLAAPALGLVSLMAVGTGALVYWNHLHPIEQKGSPTPQPAVSASSSPQTGAGESGGSTSSTSSGGTTGAGTASATGAAGKTEIVTVHETNAGNVNWDAELKGMNWLRVVPAVDRPEDCPLMEGEKPVLYYTHKKKDMAAKTRDALKEKPQIVEADADDMTACGGRELLVMPALEPTSDAGPGGNGNDTGVAGQAKSGIEAAKQKIQKGAQRVLHPPQR